ncbi:DNA-binding transcriptional LysR family regulator [Luteibacter rhizovicinus]|uniref:DNA-binding transcriptional LysR family regulator n=1 Tax=Luteibacter rhizovicinus TaxID=242606 RepID=A0A4R3YQK3_9GAMM|nr:LysR family transcriptional regulator [Luteibacter rhizovicinus]TCV94700.1 DNA-binding transcriptional LysR family regulator [Luteibacter rhizovicinus]
MALDVNLNRLAVFAALVRAGSFTAAADQLGTTKAMVSQHLAKLEEELGIVLVVRSTRRMSLTEAGELFHADCVRILADAEASIERLNACRETPRGLLRVAAAGDHGPTIVAPALAAYAQAFPDVTVELVIADSIVDLIAERFDVAIRLGWLRDSSLRATRLAGFRQIPVGAPDYLARHGNPDHPADLAKHHWIALAVLSSPTRWTFTDATGGEHAVRTNPVTSSNSTHAVREFVRAGHGISVLPDYMLADDLASGALRPLLPGFHLPDGGIHAVYPGAKPSAKVRAFIDLLRERVEAR